MDDQSQQPQPGMPADDQGGAQMPSDQGQPPMPSAPEPTGGEDQGGQPSGGMGTPGM